MCDQCSKEKCSRQAEPLCRECLQEFILETVLGAMRHEATAVREYHDKKRRFEQPRTVRTANGS